MTSFVEIGYPNAFNDLLELLDISQTRALYPAEAEKVATWMKKDREELQQYRFNAAISHDEYRVAESHGKPCYYCKEPVNALAGNPGLWPIVMSHRDEPGVPKIHHMSCVQERLDEWK